MTTFSFQSDVLGTVTVPCLELINTALELVSARRQYLNSGFPDLKADALP